MISLNRTAIVVRPGQAFLDWLHATDLTSSVLTLENLQREPSVYLLPDCEDEQEVRECLEEICGKIFEEQLDGWYRVPSSWPSRLDLDTFDHWFEWSFHPMVFDLCDDPLLQEEI